MRTTDPLHSPGPQSRPPVQRPAVRSVDGMRAARPQVRPEVAKPAERPAQTKTAKPAKKSRRPSKFQTPLLVLAIVAGGFLIQQSAAIGELCIVVYAIVALKQKIAARLTFILALLAFVGVLLMLLFRANQELAANFALYAFLLLAVGVMSLIRELTGSKDPRPSRR